MSVYGFQGYGWFWAIVESLRQSETFEICFTSKNYIGGLAYLLRTDFETAKKFLHDCIDDFELFESDGESFWSKSLKDRMQIMNDKNKKNKENAMIRWEKQRKNQTESAQGDVIAEKTEDDKPKKEKRVKTENATVAQDEPVSGTVSTLTDFLIRKMKSNNAQAKIPNDLKKWHDAIRLMMDADGYTEQQVSEMIDFSQKDGFWKANILSATKLREKAGTLILQMGRVNDAKSWTSGETATGTDSGYKINGSVSPERIAELLEKKRKREEENLRMQQVSG